VNMIDELRDPFYRHECRQAKLWRAGSGGVLLLLVFLGLVLFCGQLAVLAVLCIPTFAAAEGLLYEFDAGTLEGLLLTPADRTRLLVAKLLARLRGLFLLGALCPVVFAATAGVTYYFVERDTRGAGLAADVARVSAAAFAWGVPAGLLVIGQSFTCGAVGLWSAIQGRGRTSAYLHASLYVVGLAVGEVVVAAVVASFSIGVMRIGDADLAAGLTLLCLAFLLRLTLVNWVLPRWLIGRAARRMDELLLRDS